jgi:myo-inositol 2-dehydrogenase/D-chiro-inositol 1-dehydrogenase
MSKTVKVGLIGAGFVSDLHAFSIHRYVTNAEIVAVVSPTPGKAARFAKEHSIPNAFEDYHDLLALKDIDVITVAIPNDLHAQVTVDAARAGKHVICEKPLCKTMEEANQMIDECRRHGVLLLYAEELLFAPKYVRAKTLVDEGTFGNAYLVKHWEEHYGPHMPWFWDVKRSGGGVMMDMGCHSIEYTRWVLGKPPVKSVTATMGTFVHGDKTLGEDHAITVIEYEGNRLAFAEDSWAKPGGMDDRVEIYGSQGHTRADMLRGNALITYSNTGYGYAVEKAETTKGWTFTTFEETWNYGFPQEMQHFVNCVAGTETPMETGEDGREVMKIIYAAYQAAGEGRKIEWPYQPPQVEKPVDLWKRR